MRCGSMAMKIAPATRVPARMAMRNFLSIPARKSWRKAIAPRAAPVPRSRWKTTTKSIARPRIMPRWMRDLRLVIFSPRWTEEPRNAPR